MKMAYKEEGKWWVSPANYLPEVTKNYHFPEHIEILDTTLRDGEQEPGIIFTKEDKVAIAKRLDAAGVHRIEAGCPMTSEEDAAAIKEICALGLKAKIYCFVRGVMSDMDVAKACGVDGVVIEVPGSEQMLQGGMRWGMEKAIKAASEATRYAHELGLMVTFFPSVLRVPIWISCPRCSTAFWTQAATLIPWRWSIRSARSLRKARHTWSKSCSAASASRSRRFPRGLRSFDSDDDRCFAGRRILRACHRQRHRRTCRKLPAGTAGYELAVSVWSGHRHQV